MPKPKIDDSRERIFDEYRSPSDLTGAWSDSASQFGNRDENKRSTDPVDDFLRTSGRFQFNKESLANAPTTDGGKS